MDKVVKAIYKGMLSPKKEMFLLKFVIMYKNKELKIYDLLRKIRLINFERYENYIKRRF